MFYSFIIDLIGISAERFQYSFRTFRFFNEDSFDAAAFWEPARCFIFKLML